MGVAKANDLTRLVAGYFTDSFTSTLKSAAMHIAIGEIVYESSGTYGLGTGVFNVNAAGASGERCTPVRPLGRTPSQECLIDTDDILKASERSSMTAKAIVLRRWTLGTISA